MLIVSCTIAPEKLIALLTDGSEVCFAETGCVVTVREHELIGDSPYGYIDFMGSVSDTHPLLMWADSWSPLPVSQR